MSTNNKNTDKKETSLQVPEKTLSHRFLQKVQQEFSNAVGSSVGFGEHEKVLAQNFYVKLENLLQEFEARRADKQPNATPYEWKNINIEKLALDSVHYIRCGLDALIPNHIQVVPYFNKRRGQYDLNVRPGYEGKLYIAKKFSIEPVTDIIVELVHENDDFTVIKRNGEGRKESFEFEVPQPFERGEVIGGFGYVMFEDERLNKLVTVDEAYFKKIKNESQSNAFWGKWGDEMRFKTIAHRTAEKVASDPRKVHSSFHKIQADDDPFKEDQTMEIDINSEDSDEDHSVIDAKFEDDDTPHPALDEPKQQEAFNGVDMSDFEKESQETAFN